MNKYLVAMMFLVTPVLAADLPPPTEAQQAPAKVVKAATVVNVSTKISEIAMTQGGDRLIISCSDTCSATRVKSGKVESISLGAGGAKEFKKHVKAAHSYGWK